MIPAQCTFRVYNLGYTEEKIMITTLPCPPKELVPDKICSSLCFEIQCTCSEISHLLRLKQVITHTTLSSSPTNMILIIWDTSLPKVISSLQYIRLHYATDQIAHWPSRHQVPMQSHGVMELTQEHLIWPVWLNTPSVSKKIKDAVRENFPN